MVTTTLLVLGMVIKRYMEHFKMVKDNTVKNVYIYGHIMSCFIIPFNYYKIAQSTNDYEMFMRVFFVIVMSVRSLLSVTFISIKCDDWYILPLCIALFSCGPILYFINPEGFAESSKYIMSVFYMYGFFAGVMQIRKLLKTKSSKGLSLGAVFVGLMITILDGIYAYSYDNHMITIRSVLFIIVGIIYGLLVRRYK